MRLAVPWGFPSSLSLCFLLFSSLLAPVLAFSFDTTKPTQCQDWTITWDSGTAPFYLMIVPTMTITGGRIQNITLNTTSGPPYTSSFKLRQPAGLEFTAVLSDATGWGSHGVSEIKLVSVSEDTSCLDVSPALADFYFYTEPQDSPPQCSSMRVVWNDNVTYPAGLHGLVPGGSAWDIPIPQQRGQFSANWTVNIASGTRFILLMSDSGRYGTGGSTIPLTVQYSGNNTCMSADSPQSSPVTSSQTVTQSSTSTGPSAGPSSSAAAGGNKSNAGAIAGGVVGGIVGALLILAAIWFLCHWRKRRDAESGPQMGERRSQETTSRLLGRFGQRSSGYSGTGRRPQSNFEIDVFEGQHPDSASVGGEHSDSAEHHIQPYPYAARAPGSQQRDSMISTETDGSRSRVAFASLPPVRGVGEFGDKDILAAAMSHAGSTTPGSPSAHSRQSSATGIPASRRGNNNGSSSSNNGNPDHLYTVSELALASAASGRPVDREELLAIIDPPPKYQHYDALRANNPDGDLNNPDAADPPAAPAQGSPRPSDQPERSPEEVSRTTA